MIRKALLALLTLLSLTQLLPAQDRKVALVIGNSAYQNVAVLPNPKNDATDMTVALGRLGFEVIPVIDGSYAAMDDAVLRFSRKLSGASTGLFYYAGHGVQSNGANYILPVDAKVEEEFQLKQKAIDAAYVLDAMSAAGVPLNIVILDACRDNPWKKGSRSLGGVRGLAVVGNAPQGTIIVYATDPGSIAMDGDGRNGTFTAALLKHIGTSGLDIKEMLDRVGNDVSTASKGSQNPWVSSKFYGKFYFAGGASSAGPVPAPRIPSPSATIAAGEYKIGDRGPAGGIVFYDKGSISDGWRYLEAAPSDQSIGVRWYKGKYLNIETGTALGSGKANTEAIIAAQGSGSYAATLCKNLLLGGNSDWFLPSKDELNLMYTNLKKVGLGGFGEGWLWSSSQNANSYGDAWIQRFSDASQFSIVKGNKYVVRACRSF